MLLIFFIYLYILNLDVGLDPVLASYITMERIYIEWIEMIA